MMKIRGVLWPDEWLSAMGAGNDLLSASRKTANGVLKIFLSLFFPLAVGGSIFFVTDRYIIGLSEKVDEDVLRAVVTVVAILAGFMITTILFTGRPNGLSSLTSHELRDVRDKVSYLVLSQCLTLASHMGCVLFCLICIGVFDDSMKSSVWVGESPREPRRPFCVSHAAIGSVTCCR
jgi:hypothetical protein